MADILIAEDEDGVRRFACRALELEGHVMTEARDGAEAIDLLHKHDGKFDLVLTDIKMPVMDGIALALSMAREWPEIPILMMTGFAEQRARASGLDHLIEAVIAKPFTIKQIQTAVIDALAGNSD